MEDSQTSQWPRWLAELWQLLRFAAWPRSLMLCCRKRRSSFCRKPATAARWLTAWQGCPCHGLAHLFVSCGNGLTPQLMRKTRVYDLGTCLCLRPLGGRQDVPLDSPAKLLRTTVLEKSSFNKLILPKQALCNRVLQVVMRKPVSTFWS